MKKPTHSQNPYSQPSTKVVQLYTGASLCQASLQDSGVTLPGGFQEYPLFEVNIL